MEKDAMIIYHYNHDTGEIVGSSVADADPMAGVDEDGEPLGWLIPANATTIPAPQPMPGNIRVFRGESGWGYVKASDPLEEPTAEPHGPDENDVADERARRLGVGFQFDFHDERGVHFINTSAADMAGWDEVTKIANALIMSGEPNRTIDIKTGTGPVRLTAMDWQQILIRAGQVRQPIFAASFALQAADPIPADYKDDKYWPNPEDDNAPHVTPLPGQDVAPPHVVPPILPITGDPNNAPHVPIDAPTDDRTITPEEPA